MAFSVSVSQASLCPGHAIPTPMPPWAEVEVQLIVCDEAPSLDAFWLTSDNIDRNSDIG